MTKIPEEKGKVTKPDVPEQEPGGEEQPQIYTVKKNLTGWNFSRRKFLSAATTAAAAAATAATTGVRDVSGEKTSKTIKVSEVSIAMAMTIPTINAVRPGQSLEQVWQFTNDSDTVWCKGAKLHFVNSEQTQALALIPVPDIAPGETVSVRVNTVAPIELSAYQTHWRLETHDTPEAAASGVFILLNGCIIESAHPYENNQSQTWTVNNPDTNAQSTRVHFSQVMVETNRDYIVLKDETGREIQRITGNYPDGMWSNPIPGQVVQVQLITDSSGTDWGFCLDQVETRQLIYLPVVLKNSTVPTDTPTQMRTPTNTPTQTRTPTNTPTRTRTPTNTPTQTRTPTNTPTQTRTPTNTPTQTRTPTNTPTQTRTPTNTPTYTPTPTDTPTYTPTPTDTPTYTPTPTDTYTPTPTPVCSCVGDVCSCVNNIHYWHPN